MSTCSRHQHIIDAVGDLDRLPPETSRHVDACVACETFGRDLVALRALLREAGRVTTPVDFDARLAERLRGRRPAAAASWSWSAHRAPLAAAACLVVALSSALALRSLPGEEPVKPAPSSEVASAAPDADTPDTPAAEEVPVIVANVDSPLPYRRDGQVALRASRVERRVARPSGPSLARVPEEEVEIYFRDTQGAHVVNFGPVLYGAQQILPAVAAPVRDDSGQAVTSF
jgi:hypothetical protein